MTIKEIEYEIINILGRDTDESIINTIGKLVVQERARMLKQRIKKGDDPSKYESSITFELESSTLANECNLPICAALKTKLQIPTAINIEGMPQYKVSTVDLLNWIGYINPQEIPFFKHSKWTSKDLRWTLINDYVYILNNQLLTKINIVAVYDDPLSLEEYDCSDCKPDKLHVSDDMASQIISNIYRLLTPLQPQTQHAEIDEDLR